MSVSSDLISRNGLARNIVNDEHRTYSTTVWKTPPEAIVARFRQFAAIIHTTSIGGGYKFELTAQLWNLALGKELWRVSRVIEQRWEYTRKRETAITQEGAVTIKFPDLDTYVFIKDGKVTGVNQYEYDNRFCKVSAFRDDGALFKVCERKFNYDPSEITLQFVNRAGKSTHIASLPEFSKVFWLNWSLAQNDRYFVLCSRITNALFVYDVFNNKHFTCIIPEKDWSGTLFLLDDCVVISKQYVWVQQFESKGTIVSTYKITSEGLDPLKEFAVMDSPELCFINPKYALFRFTDRFNCIFRLFDLETEEITFCTMITGKPEEINLTVSDEFIQFNNIFGHASVFDLTTKKRIHHTNKTLETGKASSFEAGIRLTTHTTDKGISLTIDDFNPNSELHVCEDAS